jgi:hypothetical protein
MFQAEIAQLAVVFQSDAGALEKQGPDERSESGSKPKSGRLIVMKWQNSL